MLQQSKGKMYLAAGREHSENTISRCYNTFAYGARHTHQKEPFGALYLLSDYTLAGGKSLHVQAEEDTCLVMLPLVGAVLYKNGRGDEAIVEAGEAQLQVLPAGATATIENPYEVDLVNFLCIGVKASSATPIQPRLFSFDLLENRNKLVELFLEEEYEAGHSKTFIAKFEGRAEAVYHRSSSENGLFVFVLEGAFEVQYRLLEARDGLALWETDEIEIEALSNNALLLVLEVPLTKFGIQ